jgi:hypothetical protein
MTYLLSEKDSHFTTPSEKSILFKFLERFEETLFGWLMARYLGDFIKYRKKVWFSTFRMS